MEVEKQDTTASSSIPAPSVPPAPQASAEATTTSLPKPEDVLIVKDEPKSQPLSSVTSEHNHDDDDVYIDDVKSNEHENPPIQDPDMEVVEYDSEEEDVFPSKEKLAQQAAQSTDEDADDPIVKKYDVYLSHTLSPNLFLFQYPLRPITRPYDFQTLKKCLYKKEHMKFNLSFERSANPEHFDLEHYKPNEVDSFSLTSNKVSKIFSKIEFFFSNPKN